MKLSKRTSVLILPVLFVSYLLAALMIYLQESRSLTLLEQNRLNQKASELSSAFNRYNGFIDTYLISLLEGDVLADFLEESNNIYRVNILSTNLDKAITRYFGVDKTFTALTILDANGDSLLYIENSTDPFATANPAILQLSKQMLQNNLISYWQHLPEPDARLQRGITIDPRTMTSPLATDMANALRLIISVQPEQFDQLVNQTKELFQADIEYTKKPKTTESGLLFATSQLGENYYLNITPNPKYLTSRLQQLQLRLSIIFAFGTLISFILLQILIKRFITTPIERLDKQLTEVMDAKIEHFDYQQGDDEVSRLGQTFHDLYEKLRSSLNKSQQMSRTDALTQLPNRTAFYDFASIELSHCEHEKRPLSILYLDLDNFKFVNDKYGHEVGDQLLKAVAARLKHTVSISRSENANNSPHVYRLSGDEFLIMLEDSDIESTEKLSSKLLHSFSQGYTFELGHFPVTASLGIAVYPNDGHTLSQLISNADLAMYQAKKSGKNKYAFYSKELAKKDRKAREIESRLKEVDCDKEFTLNYMPIIDMRGNVKGCEALLRWESPILGFISPALFIPIAESSGVFEKIDLWVIENVYKDLPKLKKIMGENTEISINISSAELNSERLTNELTALTAHYEVDAQNIILEITETFALDQEQDALDWLQALRDRGFKIAIDDFGTGYTSLMQMVDYPVDIIKFDRALIDRLTKPGKTDLSGALIDLCHLQGIAVVGEGVETEEQSNILQKARCDYQQGFYIAKPMELDVLQQWLSDRKLSHTSNYYEEPLHTEFR